MLLNLLFYICVLIYDIFYLWFLFRNKYVLVIIINVIFYNVTIWYSSIVKKFSVHTYTYTYIIHIRYYLRANSALRIETKYYDKIMRKAISSIIYVLLLCLLKHFHHVYSFNPMRLPSALTYRHVSIHSRMYALSDEHVSRLDVMRLEFETLKKEGKVPDLVNLEYMNTSVIISLYLILFTI